MRRSAPRRSPTVRRCRQPTSTMPSRISRRRCPAREAEMTALKSSSSALLVATTLVVAACSSNDTPKPTTPQNAAPTIAAVANQSVNQDTVIGPISLAINDSETATDMLQVVASADNANVIPADGIVLSGSGATRSLTLTPFEAATGSTTIAVLVTDGQGGSATRTFTVAVNARNASIKSG